MEHATKMVMVPQTAYSNLLAQQQVPQAAYSNLLAQQQQQVPTTVKQLTLLDQQMQGILNDPNLAAEQKLAEYNSTLRRYNHLKSDRPINIPSQLPVERIEAAVPKKSKRKGQILLYHIAANSSAIGVDEHNQLKVNGTVIPNTNIIDLVTHTVKNSFGGPDPAGYREFADILNATHVPTEAFGTRIRPVVPQLQRLESANDTPSAASDHDSPRVAAMFRDIYGSTVKEAPKRNSPRTRGDHAVQKPEASAWMSWRS